MMKILCTLLTHSLTLYPLYSAYYVMTEYLPLTSLHSFAAPCLTIFVLSYFVAGVFLGVLDLCILTVLHCYVADDEMFDGRYSDGTAMKEWIEGGNDGTFLEEKKRSSTTSRGGGVAVSNWERR